MINSRYIVAVMTMLSVSGAHAGSSAGAVAVSISGYVEPAQVQCTIIIEGPGFPARTFTLPACGNSGHDESYSIATSIMLSSAEAAPAPFLQYRYTDNDGTNRTALLPIVRAPEQESPHVHRYQIALPSQLQPHLKTLSLASGQGVELTLY